MKIRTSIELEEKLRDLVEAYQSDTGASFVGTISQALEFFLKSKGYIRQSKDLEIEEAISEVKKNGVSREKILEALLSLMELEVCGE